MVLSGATIALYTRLMPTIHRLSNCSICLYANDHLPPHFHLRLSDGREALIAIKELTPLTGIGGSRVALREMIEALEWASQNKARLLAMWEELNP
ncbi:DUF4160 domain-containing protein [Pseudomonas sp. PAGU 2196]|uniref:DUF4160 domain-containing protein n=1 Tax=Pseudomonas sp. PAGU 2196 TaxID=2793997 RepID=UPI0027E41014|nr:DUF4160 domain-containing protein [Pseudomonas sp. PAGU 2196]